MLPNRLRLLRIQKLLKEAEKLTKEEAHHQHDESRLTRLGALIWVSRDCVDEIVEEKVHKPEPPEGRPDRDHL